MFIFRANFFRPPSKMPSRTPISLTISIIWVWNAKLGNFNYQEGKRAFESTHVDILMFNVQNLLPHENWGELPKRPNKIFAADPLMKTAKFSQFGRKKAKFPTLLPIL